LNRPRESRRAFLSGDPPTRRRAARLRQRRRSRCVCRPGTDARSREVTRRRAAGNRRRGRFRWEDVCFAMTCICATMASACCTSPMSPRRAASMRGSTASAPRRATSTTTAASTCCWRISGRISCFTTTAMERSRTFRSRAGSKTSLASRSRRRSSITIATT